jgi:succinate dehydrogenase/fumarate reductase-like Fe-S protein
LTRASMDQQPTEQGPKDWALVEIRRSSGTGPSRYDTFRVPFDPGLTVMDVLRHIAARLDPTLGFRRACDCSYCGVCAVRLDGRPVLACESMMTRHMRLDPLREPVARDLITSHWGG